MLLAPYLATLACVAPEPEAPPSSTEGPRYLVGGVVYGPDGPFGYGAVVDRLGPDVTVDLEMAGVFPGFPSLGIPEEPSGRVFVGLAESPVIQRWELTEQDTIDLTGEVSVQPFGSISGGGALTVVGDRGYLFSGFTLDVMVFDTEEMVLVEQIDLDVATPAGGWSYFAYDAPRDGDQLVTVVSHHREDDTTGATIRGVFLDTATGEVTYDALEGCGGIATHARDEDGNLYFASLPSVSARTLAGLGGDPACPGCIVKIASGTSRFDDTVIDLTDMTGTPVGSLAGGASDIAYTLLYDPSTVPLTPENWSQLTLEPHWSYAAIDLTDPAPPEPVPGLPVGEGAAISFSVVEGDDATPTPYIGVPSQGFGSTDWYDMTDPDAPEYRMTVPGLGYRAVRLR